MRMLLPLCCVVAGCSRESPVARLDPDEITEVRVEDAPWKATDSFAPIVCQNREAIESLLSVLKNATAASDHKCAPQWRLTLISTRGDVILDMLPGHNEASYEFRYNKGLYTISRLEFVEAMRRIGLQELPLEPW